MTILEKDIQTPELEARHAKSQDFAFFMPSLIDHSDVAGLRREIVDCAELVNKFHIEGSPLRASMQTALDESLDTFKAAVEANEGGMLVLATMGPIGARQKNIEWLQAAYGNDARKEDERQTFVVPADKITAVRALGYAGGEGTPDPVLVLRIETGFEQPTTYYAGPGTLAELESPGSWYQFKFTDINVGLMTPSAETSAA